MQRQYGKRQISTALLAANNEALDKALALRPLHPRRLAVESEIWPKYAEAHRKARGEKRKAISNAFEREVNALLFPDEAAAIRTALHEAGRELNMQRMCQIEALIEGSAEFSDRVRQICPSLPGSGGEVDDYLRAERIAAGFILGQIERSLQATN